MGKGDQQRDAEAAELPADKFLFIAKAEPKLSEWLAQTTYGYALYQGANEALRHRIYPAGDASQLADHYREPSTLLSVLRVYALFDRYEPVSFQAVKRRIVDDEVQTLLVNHFVGRNETSRPLLEGECRSHIAAFLSAYGTIDFAVIRRLQHFRNIGLVHITFQEVEKTINRQELYDLVHLAGRLSQALTLALRDRHTSRIEDMDLRAEHLTKQWTACMHRDLAARG